MDLSDTLRVANDGWSLTETGWEDERAVAVGSNFMVGNGYLGYRGTSPEQGPDDYVALVVTDTYDCADGQWRELTTAPNPLFVSACVEGVPVTVDGATHVETTLAMRTGEFRLTFGEPVDDADIAVSVERFASYDDLHLLGQRWSLASDEAVSVDITFGIDARIWSLNGTHLPEVVTSGDAGVLTAAGRTVESGIDVAVAAVTHVRHGHGGPVETEITDDGAMRTVTVHLDGSDEVVIETIAAVYTSNDTEDPLARAVGAVSGTDDGHCETIRNASRIVWRDLWAVMDIEIEGNLADQAAVRFAAYHNRICTPAHTDRLPIGARGLSCQAYQGAAFWDQEIYNLPAYLFTEPDIARSILVYRHRTLDGARRKAERLGYNGAFYAWISGDTGDELCPDYFFEDVLTGRPIRNHFNVWQIHVAPDVVTTIERYVEVTGDETFLVDHGAEIAFEVARFLRSFVRYDEWRGVYHCIRLLGPDEWHENVDDNAFTNHQVVRALSFAIDTHDRLAAVHPDALADLAGAIDLTADEVEGWRRVRDRMFLPRPDAETQLIEQFTGFFDLEDISPDRLAERLLHPQEYWGWPNGIAVATQVSKQADVAMLLWLHADAFDDATVRANYEYYEPRCSHQSSLSHAAHGMVAARLGDVDAAYAHLRGTAMVDLLNTNHPVVGGTFIGGIHTAACGGTVQLAVEGIGGLGFGEGRLTINPALPRAWDAIAYPVSWRGNRMSVRVDHDLVTVAADSANPDTVVVEVGGESFELPPGGDADIEYR